MQLDHYVNTLGKSLKQKYGGRVRKLSIDGDFTCPNRDGTLGRGGCTFCSIDSFADKKAAEYSVSEQIQQRKLELKHQDIRYLAYFQAYTNTHAEVDYLRNLYFQALNQPDIIGLCVGTRPDCLNSAVLALLADIRSSGKEVWLEIGLQSAKNETLKKINRGHDFSCYQQAAKTIAQYELQLCCHLILGLPGEHYADYKNTLHKVLETGVQGLKLHPLHVVENSPMARTWRANRLSTLTQEEYVAAAASLIQLTPKNIIYHRVTAQARPKTLVAPQWCGNKWQPIVAITKKLHETGGQGSRL